MNGKDDDRGKVPSLWVMARNGKDYYLISPVGNWDDVQRHPRPIGIGVRPGKTRFGFSPNLHSVLSRTQYYPYNEVPPEQTERWLREVIGYGNEEYDRLIGFVQRILAEREKYRDGNFPNSRHDGVEDDEDAV